MTSPAEILAEMKSKKKWSLNQLGWENPCCLRNPILQNNPREKFVVFGSDYDRLIACLEKCIEQRDLYIWTETETEAIAREELALADSALAKILTGNEEVKE